MCTQQQTIAAAYVVCALRLLADPLSHISDREDVYTALCSGGRVGIASSVGTVFDDIRLLEPTRVSSTPRFWNVV